jgi:hypothetical protein
MSGETPKGPAKSGHGSAASKRPSRSARRLLSVKPLLEFDAARAIEAGCLDFTEESSVKNA